MKLSEDMKEWIRDISISVVCALVILTFFKPTIVKQHSMENTLQENDYLFVSRQAYRLFGDPQRGDIIVFSSELTTEKGQNKNLIKRIIGLPGDTIAIKNGKTILNGEEIDEPYTRDGITMGDMKEVTVPEGKLFVMGDNRQNSADSRSPSVGMVDMKTIMGKAVFRLFPFSKMGGIH